VAVIAVRDILADVHRADPVSGIRIVGVDGPSGSGKSTLARKLAASAAASLVQIDDFVSWDDLAGWWPRFEQQVLAPLLAGHDARYQARDWTGDEFGRSLRDWKTAARTPLIVIEGVTCTRAQTVGRLAYAIWVEAPAATWLRRGLERDGGSHRALWERWQAEEDEFFRADGTRERADLIIDSDWRLPHDPDTHVATLQPRPSQR
jgi:uridine kinase